MAYLYATSATWRALVNATRDRRVLAVFAVSLTGATYYFGRGAQLLTQPATDSTTERLRASARSDPEMRRYAATGNKALATMFASFGKGEDTNEKHLQGPPLKLPGVMWHPSVMSDPAAAASPARNDKASRAPRTPAPPAATVTPAPDAKPAAQ